MYVISELYDINQRIKEFSDEELYELINKIIYLRYNNLLNNTYLTPLEIEILMNNKKKVLNLINNGANLNEISPSGFYPIEVAIVMSNFELTKFLIEKGALVNLESKHPPLYLAVMGKNYEIVKLLIDNDVDVNRLDENGFNALHYLLDNGSNFYVDTTIFKKNFYKARKKRPTDDDIIAIIDILVKNKINVNCEGQKMLIVKEEMVNININPLSIALEVSSPKVIKKLLESGSERKAIEIHPSSIYEYQESFSFLEDIIDGDLSLWIDAPGEFVDYLKYINKIKRFGIEVYSATIDDGYRRSKRIKKL